MPLLEKQVLGSFVSLSPSSFVDPCCHVPSMTRRDVSLCLDIQSARVAAGAGRGSPMSSLSLA